MWMTMANCKVKNIQYIAASLKINKVLQSKPTYIQCFVKLLWGLIEKYLH